MLRLEALEVIQRFRKPGGDEFASPSGLDPNAMMFANSNVGGAYSVSFTAHIDSAWGNNPIGFILHLFIDVFGSKSRKPCP